MQSLRLLSCNQKEGCYHMNIILIAIGGSIGAICRYLIGKMVNPQIPQFPYGTLTVNLIGAFLLGWLFGHDVNHVWMLLIGTGFCGAITTFSTLQWEAVQLYKNKKGKPAMYLGITYFFGLIVATIGYILGR